jgi:diguanylate cyclase (GGDEF)-like protein/PAS domain S-box-containing protein
MRSERRLSLAFALALLSMVVVAAFLLQRNVAVEAYSDRLALLHEAGRLDARMDEDMQRILSLQLLHYDTLVETVTLLQENTAQIASTGRGLRGSVADGDFDAAITAYQQTVAYKVELLERIKWQVALLRNALQYLPGLLEELTLNSSPEQVTLERGLLSALMEYNLFPGDENYQNLLAKVELLKVPRWEAGQQELLNYLLLHLNNSVTLRGEIEALAREYRAQPGAQWLTQLRKTFSASYQAQSSRFYYTSLLLLLVLFVLFLGLGYLLLSLQRTRRAAERAWQQLHDALESISEAFVLFDPFDRLVLWNRKYAELYPASGTLLAKGASFADLARVRINNGEYPAESPAAQQLAQLLAHHRNIQQSEVETLGNGRHYLVSNSRTSGGGIASVYIDITERREAEEQLRIAAAVFETSSEGIVVTDHFNRIIAVNPGFTRITGYQPDEVVGQAPSILSSGRHGADYYREMWQALYEHNHWEGEIWNRNKRGATYPEWLSLTLVRDADGAVIEHIAVFSDISRRKQDEEKIRWQANYDPVTGLPNRTLFQERLNASISSSHREEWITALLFIDLDHFKMVNDTRGHAVGDWLLQEVAGRLAACIREADTVARLGGDEFTVVLQDVHGADDAAMVAQQIATTMAEPFFAEEGDIFIGASIGITLYPHDGQDAETLLRNADLAMYQAKEAGRNGYSFFTQSMNERIQERTRLENAMRYALQRDEFFLEFQPIIDSRSGETVRAEALIRWHHPQLGGIAPQEFISIAEESGLIAHLGWWILEQSCRAATDWMQRGFDTGVSVNVSARQIQLGLNVEDIVSLLQELSLPPQRLTLEITESLLLEDTEKTLAWLRRVRVAGIKLSVDDFGTGFSSLSYLKRFPVNSLKIDQGFVRDVTTDTEDAALIRAIIKMAEAFGLDIIAEGVEFAEQLAFLQQHGCYLIQGYYFSRPLGHEALIAFLQSRRDGVPNLPNVLGG